MDINVLMNETVSESNRQKLERLKATLDKNKANLDAKDIAEGGRYYKAYSKLQSEVLSAAQAVFKDEVLEGFPVNETTKPIFTDIWTSIRDILKEFCFDGKMEYIDWLFSKTQKIYENRANEALGTDIHYNRVKGINMPIQIVD